MPKTSKNKICLPLVIAMTMNSTKWHIYALAPWHISTLQWIQVASRFDNGLVLWGLATAHYQYLNQCWFYVYNMIKVYIIWYFNNLIKNLTKYSYFTSPNNAYTSLDVGLLFVGVLPIYVDLSMSLSSWCLQMPWCHIGTRASASTMLTWKQCIITLWHIAENDNSVAIKKLCLWEVGRWQPLGLFIIG